MKKSKGTPSQRERLLALQRRADLEAQRLQAVRRALVAATLSTARLPGLHRARFSLPHSAAFHLATAFAVVAMTSRSSAPAITG